MTLLNTRKTLLPDSVTSFLSRNSKNIVLLLLMLTIFIIFTMLSPNRFPTMRNYRNMLGQIPEFGLLTLAMMLAMIVGGIDLSVVAVANICGVFAAKILTAEFATVISGGTLMLIVVIVVVITAAICGLFNGTLIGVAGVPPILATLGTQGLLMGLAIIITRGFTSMPTGLYTFTFTYTTTCTNTIQCTIT